MRLIQICLLTATIISCNSSGNKKEGSVSTEQQKKIDSLSNVIKDREEKDKQLLEAKEKQRELQATVSERNSVLSKVTIDKPAFIQLSLGGLEDIRFNLFNDYKYNVEQIVLKVHYIRANGTEIKSETQILNDIPANSRKALTAPNYSAAGKSVKVSIETVLCKALELCYYNTPDSIASNDPYKCR